MFEDVPMSRFGATLQYWEGSNESSKSEGGKEEEGVVYGDAGEWRRKP
jgi:hypothetical protein